MLTNVADFKNRFAGLQFAGNLLLNNLEPFQRTL